MNSISKYSLLYLLCFCTITGLAHAQIKTIKDYFPEQKAKVLVVGTFHFDYPGLDAHKTAAEDQIDVLQEPKKSEVSELVAYIKRFKPNKIAIEATDDWKASEKLRRYRQGAYRDERDERFQLAMRIATDAKLDTLYAIDANSMADDLAQIDSNYISKLFAGYDFQSDDPFEAYVKKWLEEDDKLTKTIPLLDYFMIMNSRESHQYGYGCYLIGDFKLGNQRGADILSSWWYNRNMRIFRNLQKITSGPDDRILVIFGNGHAAILRQLIECSPEYEFVEFDSL